MTAKAKAEERERLARLVDTYAEMNDSGARSAEAEGRLTFAEDCRRLAADFRAIAALLRDTSGYDWSRAVTALENWGRHFDWCESRTTSEPLPCNCGLARELEDLRAQGGE